MKRQGRRPVLITDAEPSQDDQLRMREVRYLIMMSARAVLLIVAAVLVGLRVPLLPLWLVLCVVAMVLLPWLAVILANDRPPKEEHRLSHRFHHRARVDEAPPNALAAPHEPVVIDADDVVDVKNAADANAEDATPDRGATPDRDATPDKGATPDRDATRERDVIDADG